MSNTEIQSKVNELRELRRMADELTAEIENIQDAIKAHMTAIDADTLTGVDYKITWKTVTIWQTCWKRSPKRSCRGAAIHIILRCRSGFREQGDQRRVCADIRLGERLGGSKVNTSLAAASRADDEREKAELIALVRMLTPKEADRVIERMQALLNEQQKKKEVAE